MAEQIEWLEPGVRGHRGQTKPLNLVEVHIVTKKGVPSFLNVSFGREVLGSMGWQRGTQLIAGKTPSGGMVLAKLNGQGNAAAYKLNKNGNLRLNKNAIKWFPADFKNAKLRLSWRKDGDMLVATIPPESDVRRAELKVLGE